MWQEKGMILVFGDDGGEQWDKETKNWTRKVKESGSDTRRSNNQEHKNETKTENGGGRKSETEEWWERIGKEI